MIYLKKNVIVMYENNNQLGFIDILSILSFAIAIENLKENREQSESNDVQKANDKQAHYLLDEIKRLFQEQNEMLGEILDRLG